MSGNSGAWGIAMWQDGYSTVLLPEQEQGISLEGGDPVLPYLPTDPVGTLLVPPDGLGVPPVRSGDVAFAQRDGVVQFADYYEPRQITLQVLVKNDACPGCSSSPQVDGALVLSGADAGRARTPDSPGLTITGDLDVRVHLAADDWTPAAAAAPVSQWLTAGVDQRGWTTRINTTGTLALFWSTNGTNATVQSAASSVALPVIPGGTGLWLRYTLDVDNGAAGRDIRFYTSTDGVNWTQLGTTITQAGVTSVHNSTADLVVGSYNNGGSERFAGRVFSVEVRSGIGGTIVANPNFDQPRYSGPFVDGAGNTWTVVPPAYLQPFVAAARSARQKVARLTQEWSRSCSGATLVLFTDCHDPNASEDEKVYLGPYLVHGRPRVADVVWDRSNRGTARVTLRFDAADARLVLADTIPGTFWTTQHVQTLDADEQNRLPDPDLSGLTMTLNGATVDDSHVLSGGPSGPDGGPYFRRRIISPNTTSPMVMNLSGAGTAGVPVVAGQQYTTAWWARKDIPGGPAARLDYQWYNAAGAALSVNNGAGQSPTATWQRFSQTNVAPALAAFVQPRLIWTGTALAEQNLDFAQAWMSAGAVAGAPETVEVVGSLCVYPVISLFPGMTAPITVTYGNHQFTYNENVTTVIEINTQYGRASDGFEDVTQNLVGDFSAPLEPGVHDVSVQTANPADTGFVNVVWENAVVSG